MKFITLTTVPYILPLEQTELGYARDTFMHWLPVTLFIIKYYPVLISENTERQL